MPDQQQLHFRFPIPSLDNSVDDIAVRAFVCPVCNSFAPFESRRCSTCQAELRLHLPSQSMVATSDGAAIIDGAQWIECTKSASLGCAWLVPEEQDKALRGRCPADSLIRREPDADDTIAQEKLADHGRRCIGWSCNCSTSACPLTRSGVRRAAWPSICCRYSGGKPVTIGHANGVITIDLVESLDDYRESLRVRLGEPYRTMLGHFRHEVGHYYQWHPGRDRPGAPARSTTAANFSATNAPTTRRHRTALQVRAARALADVVHLRVRDHASVGGLRGVLRALSAHHRHHRHQREAGLVLHTDKVRFAVPRDITPLPSYDDQPIERLLYDWKWLSLFFNRVNSAMGKNPLYPFVIPAPVIDKLGFIHRVIRETARGT